MRAPTAVDSSCSLVITMGKKSKSKKKGGRKKPSGGGGAATTQAVNNDNTMQESIDAYLEGAEMADGSTSIGG